MPLVRSSDGASFTVTHEPRLPANDNAPPYLPAVDQVAPVTVPVLPRPDTSLTTVPAPSSKEYAATSPLRRSRGSSVSGLGLNRHRPPVRRCGVARPCRRQTVLLAC